MKKLIPLSIAVLLFNCSSEDNTVQSRGTRLLSIDYIADGTAWTENYYYNADSLLTTIEDLRSVGQRYEISYENGRIAQYRTYTIENNTEVYRDSITYNAEGEIDKICSWPLNQSSNSPLIYAFSYDASLRVRERKTYLGSTEKYFRLEKYFWEGNNISRVEEYNEDDEFHYEYFYTYDDKNNYKKDIPPHLVDPLNWSPNNVIKMDWLDYYGNLDIFCRPCITTYEYNLDDYPVSVQRAWKTEMTLKYE